MMMGLEQQVSYRMQVEELEAQLAQASGPNFGKALAIARLRQLEIGEPCSYLQALTQSIVIWEGQNARRS